MDPFFLSLGLLSRPVPKSQGKCRINIFGVLGGQMLNSSQNEGTAATNHFFGGTLSIYLSKDLPRGNYSEWLCVNNKGHIWSIQVI